MEILSRSDTIDFLEYINILEMEYRRKLNLSPDTTFGIEIEMDNLFKDVLNGILKVHPEAKYTESLEFFHKTSREERVSDRYWHKKDESIGKRDPEKVCEIVSPILRDTEADWEEIKTWCNIITEGGGIITDECASHIHFGAHRINLNYDNLITLLRMCIIYEPYIIDFYMGNRKPRDISWYAQSLNIEEITNMLKEGNCEEYKDPHNPWCTFIFMKEYLTTLIEYAKRTDTLERNFSLNIIRNQGGKEVDYKNTLELRCPNGTLEHVIWQNNVNFFAKMEDAVVSGRVDKEFIKRKFNIFIQTKRKGRVSLSGALELAYMIFTNELDIMYFLKQCFKLYDIESAAVRKLVPKNY